MGIGARNVKEKSVGGKALTRASVSNAEISITRVYFEAELENWSEYCFFSFRLLSTKFCLPSFFSQRFVSFFIYGSSLLLFL